MLGCWRVAPYVPTLLDLRRASCSVVMIAVWLQKIGQHILQMRVRRSLSRQFFPAGGHVQQMLPLRLKPRSGRSFSARLRVLDIFF